ncbi:GAF domain-containing protein [Aliiruegeria haliotis]|uniref:GAF domain-containing protein n=1 Tax=Aliiruegeria haliotis TaxID=1280846 RepID=A0A2T0RY25_9RHOB|nr:GAF domain-containing protein [Aliiruegeria haliotis]PRY26068.1 GAF domain-containing protein [Aliiruegeria haliotis]
MSAERGVVSGIASDTAYSLGDLGLDETRSTETFQGITRLATRLLGAPVALISIILEEEGRQVFVGEQGLDEPLRSLRQVPLSHSFSRYVKRDREPLAIRCAREHPMVKGNPGIELLGTVAYLGVPVHGPDGAVLGALCVIDHIPRDWTGQEVSTLVDLARCVSDEILLRAALLTSQALVHDLEDAHARLRRYNALRDAATAAFTEPHLSTEERFTGLLQAGCQTLGMDCGAILRSEGSQAVVVARYCSDGCSTIGPGARYDLSGTFTQKLLSGPRLRHHDGLSAGMTCFTGREPGSFVGVPLALGEIAFGSLEFVRSRPRGQPWSDEEAASVGVIGMFVATQLEVLDQMDALRRSESALLEYVLDLRMGQSAALPN